MICLCGGLITEALCSGTSNSKKPVLQSIAITQYGDYEIKAPEGVDGYNPIHVNLKDRYDEGYEQGYKDGCDDTKTTYEKIIRQLNGDGETVTDDKGNTIERYCCRR